MQSNYVESNKGDTDIGRLVDLNDGQMDDLTNAGVAAGADVIDLVVNDNFDVGGITQGNFNIDKLSFFNNGVATQEVGHTMGGDHYHNYQGAPDNHTDPRSYDWVTSVNGTSVGGAIGQGLPYYSNPNVLWRGIPTGVAGTGPTAQNNAAIMNEKVAGIAASRATVVPDTTGPVAQLGTVQTLTGGTGAGKITFNVHYGDGSGVNADSLGDGNILTTGPNGFSASAKLVAIDDPAVNYGYKVATYSIDTPGPVGDLKNYAFAIQANSVKDTAGNATPAGPLTGANTPQLPVYADNGPTQSSEEGDLAGRNTIISSEIGTRYQGNFAGPTLNRFSLSAASSLNLSTSNLFYKASLYRDVNGDLKLDPSEKIKLTSPGYYASLPAGDNYYLYVIQFNGSPAFGDLKIAANFAGVNGPVTVVAPSGLAGQIYTDTNKNNRFDDGEPVLAGVTVNVKGTDSQGNPTNVNAQTDARGIYFIPAINPSDASGYTISEMPQANLSPGQGSVGSVGGDASMPGAISKGRGPTESDAVRL